METIITGLIIISLLLVVVFTIAEVLLSSQEAILASWREMEERLGERARTNLSPVAAQTISSGAVVQVTIRNDGDTKLADFDHWDVILQYYDGAGSYYTEWYPFGSGTNEWDVWDIFLDAPTVDEVYDINILNPGEEAVIWISVSPAVGVGTTNLATIATPNGITASTVFTR